MRQNIVQQNMIPNTLIMSRQEKRIRFNADQTRDILYTERLPALTEIKEGKISIFFGRNLS